MKRLFSLVTIALCSILTTFAEQITVPDIALTQGGSATVEILLSNERTNLVAFQMDLTLPEGLSLEKAGCRLSSRITDEEQDLVIASVSMALPSLRALTSSTGTSKNIHISRLLIPLFVQEAAGVLLSILGLA